MPGLPIALCHSNSQHYDYVVEHLKPEFEVVAIFTTPDSALNDLPMLLGQYKQPRTDALRPHSASPMEKEVQPDRQTFSLAFDPTLLDPGTLPVSPSLFNVSALTPATPPVVAVIVGAGFDKVFDRVRKDCGLRGGKVVWLTVDSQAPLGLDLGLIGETGSEELGRRVKSRLERWVGSEDECEKWGGALYF